MTDTSHTSFLDSPAAHRLLAYIADLELEVDRLRKQAGFVRHEVRYGLRRVEGLVVDDEVLQAVAELTASLNDLADPPGFHPALDQVVPIAVRPLAEQVFRAQRRLTGAAVGAAVVSLRLELEADALDWFPARLRHILDNLFSNALRYRDPAKPDGWVCLGLRASPTAYELRVSDNGLGLPAGAGRRAVELLSRAAPVRAAGVAVGLPVARLLVEESGGTWEVRSEAGKGTEFVLTLPRYDRDDFLT